MAAFDDVHFIPPLAQYLTPNTTLLLIICSVADASFIANDNEEGTKKTTNNCCRGVGTFLDDENVKLSDESLITKEGESTDKSDAVGASGVVVALAHARRTSPRRHTVTIEKNQTKPQQKKRKTPDK